MFLSKRKSDARVVGRVLSACIVSWCVYAVGGCSADAGSDEAVERVVSSLQAPYSEQTRVGHRSGQTDDATSEVSCHAYQTLTGCDCFSPWAACDGAYIAGDVCYAFNKGRGQGVYAMAQCTDFEGRRVESVAVQSTISGTSGSSSTTVSCDPGWTLTGCACYSPWAACDGASIVGSDTCQADNKAGGRGVYAEAVCLNLGETTQATLLGPRSDTFDDAASEVECPADHVLTACSCYSVDGSCDGANIGEGGVCIAWNRSRGSGVQAQARCVQVAGCHDACGGWSPDGCACDEDCEARGDCCRNYQTLCAG